MGNKQVIDRKASTELVAVAAETHAARITKGFEGAFGSYLGKKEGELPNLGLAVVLLARALRDVNHKLVDASDAYDGELADDTAPRDARDEATAALVSSMVGIRGAVETVYGAPGLRALGIDGRTPTEPKAVLSHGRKLGTSLRDAKVKLPKALRQGVKIDRKAFAAELDEPLAKLDKALKDVAREAREAQAAGDTKTRAMSANDDLFGRAATFISAALALVCEDDLAAQVRPVARRPGTAVGAEQAAGAQPSPADPKNGPG